MGVMNDYVFACLALLTAGSFNWRVRRGLVESGSAAERRDDVRRLLHLD